MALSDLPLAKGRLHVKVLQALGWQLRRRGNHLILTHQGHPGVHLSIPDHKEVDRRTLRSQVQLIGMTDKEYATAFRKYK